MEDDATPSTLHRHRRRSTAAAALGPCEGEEAQHRPNVESMSGVMRSMYATLYCKHIPATMPKESTSWESRTRKNTSS